jgi:hypothetical protein
MAALLQSYATPKANISKAIKTISTTNSTSTVQPQSRSNNSSTILINYQSKTNQPQSSPHQTPQPTSTRQKEAQKTHDQVIGQQL